ncbi:hypothetical protein ACJIZ3_007433 [Penstemon smallii]|uniref:Uncharacterized protein n=1 Tax=Penstemon smallii TaxID=265156 RepID=A0ABD3SAH8_9LAMI
MAILLEECQIQPSPETHQELSLPLIHFDIPFLKSDPTQRLLFFNFPCSKSHFLETIVPDLKKSLSSTLTQFLPLAGKIILPSNSETPTIRYISGDSVPLKIVQCDKDFNYLTKNHQRVADEFYTCVPELPPVTRSLNSVSIPVTSLQITLFQKQGICIGITNYHAICDGYSIVNFLKSWALFNKSGFREKDSLPSFERSTVQDPKGLDFMAWNLVKKSRPFPLEKNAQEIQAVPLNKVRSTFIIAKHDVEKLKKYVLNKLPNCHVSSFTVICSFIWTCLETSLAETGENVNENDPVYFSFAAECRERLIPIPLPSTYFGNCVVFVAAKSEHGKLKGKEGLLIAAEAIGEAIRKTVYCEKGILNGSDWPVDFGRHKGKRVISVAGSPRFDVYEVDFGWGMPNKYEFVHLDRERSISLCKSRDFEGGFEIGLSRTKIEMDGFGVAFNRGLEMI